MKVFDLACEHGHRFEGWFASQDAFTAQRDAERVACPVCDSHAVQRAPSAPRLNLAGNESAAKAESDAAASAARAWFERVRRIVAETEDVGPRFAEEARRIHYDEAPARAIRGTATDAEQRELSGEGIETVRIPIPRALTETLQ